MKALWRSAVALVALALVSTPAARAQQQHSRLDDVLARGKLLVVASATTPPFSFKDDKGQIVGFDIDITHLVANSLFHDPSKVEYVIVTADGRWPAIESGRADLGIGGTTIYADRALRVAFTRPFIDSAMSIMVAKSAKITSLKDLNQSSVTVANLNNPQMADRAKIYFPKAKTVTFDTPSGEFLAVKSGRAQALQIDTATADYFAGTNTKDFDVLPQTLGYTSNNAIFLRTGDFKWWLWLDTFVGELRTGSLYPEYVKIYEKWFHKHPPAQKFYLQKAQTPEAQ